MRNFTVPGCPVAENDGQKLRVRGGIENDLIVEGRYVERSFSAQLESPQKKNDGTQKIEFYWAGEDFTHLRETDNSNNKLVSTVYIHSTNISLLVSVPGQ